MGNQGTRQEEGWKGPDAYERGEAGHTIAPFGYREKLNKGQIKKEDVPYMVRGGSWDNSDVFGAKKLRWLKSGKDYARGGYKKEQSVSLLGSGPGLDWTGSRRDDDKSLKRAIPGFS